eukprot:1148694-Rhodomonas_salina.2
MTICTGARCINSVINIAHKATAGSGCTGHGHVCRFEPRDQDALSPRYGKSGPDIRVTCNQRMEDPWV